MALWSISRRGRAVGVGKVPGGGASADPRVRAGEEQRGEGTDAGVDDDARGDPDAAQDGGVAQSAQSLGVEPGRGGVAGRERARGVEDGRGFGGRSDAHPIRLTEPAPAVGGSSTGLGRARPWGKWRCGRFPALARSGGGESGAVVDSPAPTSVCRGPDDERGPGPQRVPGRVRASGRRQAFFVSAKMRAISSIFARSSSAVASSKAEPFVPAAPASFVASLTSVCSSGNFSKCGGLK